jgi:hypothetical protein
MKVLLIALSLCPALSFASIYSCNGAGFSINVTGNPVEMKIVGNGFNTMAQNVRYAATFDTVVTGNTTTPAASVKLTIKDSSFGNPGDSFNAGFQVSSAAGVKDFASINCVRGNE